MSTATTAAPAGCTRSIARHPVCRGDFAALVFSGRRRDLGELPGEPTSTTPLKLAAPDPRLDGDEDFAGGPGAVLPPWPADRIAPTEGVCFVLGDADHPFVETITSAGGRSGEHYVIVDEMAPTDDHAGVTRFVERLDDHDRIVLLGYGDQGHRLASWLVDERGLDPERLRVIEDNPDSAARAAEHGVHRAETDDLCAPGVAVISTPLAHHRRLSALAEQAAAAGCPVFDNAAVDPVGAAFTSRDRLRLDAAADRALRVRGAEVSARDHGLALEAFVVREDMRRIGAATVAHLHAGRPAPLETGDPAHDLARPDPRDGLHPETFVTLEQAWVSLRELPALGVLAGREFCAARWPEATAAVFPSAHVLDMGWTDLERQLLRHLGRCEIAMVSQTSAEQVALGVLARHHASDAPIIEIGSALGGSALLMALATVDHRPPVISIDPETATRSVMRFIFEREGQADRLEQIVERSDDAVGALRDLKGRAGLVLIDGLHTEEAARLDFEHYAPLLRPGGALLFHDAAPGWFTVLRTVLEHVLPDPRFEMRCLVDSLAVFERR